MERGVKYLHVTCIYILQNLTSMKLSWLTLWSLWVFSTLCNFFIAPTWTGSGFFYIKRLFLTYKIYIKYALTFRLLFLIICSLQLIQIANPLCPTQCMSYQGLVKISPCPTNSGRVNAIKLLLKH